ncbi:MAG: MetQ/NlpA family ABC transporter substrate-binding protein [Succinivibrio sp.]|nr:MetQ/NlpA family ABC transporter substrate-binding protein [Succinivibrio sp.]
MRTLNILKTLVAAALVGSTLWAAQAGAVVVKLGVVGEENEAWEWVAKHLKSEDIQLELVKFADYTLPNVALESGEIDLNSFQHIAFLNHEIKDKGLHLVPIGNTVISPLGLYSHTYKSVKEFKEGDTIAIPNDPTNGGRALKLLESAGLIKTDPAKGYIPERADIIENPLKLKFYEIDAANTFSLLDDVAGSVINSNYAVDNNLTPSKDAIFVDKVDNVTSDNPYINVIAAREGQQDREEFKKIVAAYQRAEVARILLETRKGASIPVFRY